MDLRERESAPDSVPAWVRAGATLMAVVEFIDFSEAPKQ
jgi:hypothetical protein